jgi:hypothetical protein
MYGATEEVARYDLASMAEGESRRYYPEPLLKRDSKHLAACINGVMGYYKDRKFSRMVLPDCVIVRRVE